MKQPGTLLSLGNSVEVLEPAEIRACIKAAAEYFAYCKEVGCDIWGLLTSMDSLCGEPVCLWLPEKLRAGKSEYVQGEAR